MRPLHKALALFALLITCASAALSAPGDVVVSVDAMIGEATLVQQSGDGKKESIVVPTGKATRKDPATGQILLAPSTARNKVNEVVHAIAASAPDSSKQLPSEDGCSQGNAPQRLAPQPEYDADAAAAIAKELQGMSSGELMMVMAVLINNAKHLCIDSSTVANTVALIATVRPEEAGNIVFVASLLDPDNSERYSQEAKKAAPNQTSIIEKKKEEANKIEPPKKTVKPPPGKSKPPIERERDIPPGGSIGKPPSPE